jgi:predicted metal-dependent hydrolase
MKGIMMVYDPLYIQFLYHFNIDRDYFECHEVMEELWLEEGRSPLYQGLLQVAVGLYHARNDNTSGAIKLFSQAVGKLELYRDHQLGIDMERLIQESRLYITELQQHELLAGSTFEFHDLDITVQDDHLAAYVNAYKAGIHD